jgi:hypothetical protein
MAFAGSSTGEDPAFSFCFPYDFQDCSSFFEKAVVKYSESICKVGDFPG